MWICVIHYREDWRCAVQTIYRLSACPVFRVVVGRYSDSVTKNAAGGTTCCLLLPPHRRLCFHLCLSVCLFVCLLTGLLKNRWSNLYENVRNGWTWSNGLHCEWRWLNACHGAWLRVILAVNVGFSERSVVSMVGLEWVQFSLLRWISASYALLSLPRSTWSSWRSSCSMSWRHGAKDRLCGHLPRSVDVYL